jgi:hypothetical protein
MQAPRPFFETRSGIFERYLVLPMLTAGMLEACCSAAMDVEEPDVSCPVPDHLEGAHGWAWSLTCLVMARGEISLMLAILMLIVAAEVLIWRWWTRRSGCAGGPATA